MIILGVILLGLLIHRLHILLVGGLALALLGAGGRTIGGRRHYY